MAKKRDSRYVVESPAQVWDVKFGDVNPPVSTFPQRGAASRCVRKVTQQPGFRAGVLLVWCPRK